MQAADGQSCMTAFVEVRASWRPWRESGKSSAGSCKHPRWAAEDQISIFSLRFWEDREVNFSPRGCDAAAITVVFILWERDLGLFGVWQCFGTYPSKSYLQGSKGHSTLCLILGEKLMMETPEKPILAADGQDHDSYFMS